MSLLSLVALIVLSFPTFAAEMLMAKITSDIDRNVTYFHLETDGEANIHSIRIRSLTPQGQVFEDFTYSTEQVLDGEVVLHERNGYKAVKLRVEKKFSPKTGGVVFIDYLFSGVTGARYNLELLLRKSGEHFELLGGDNQLVNRFYFLANRHPIFGIIGVRKVELSYAPAGLW